LSSGSGALRVTTWEGSPLDEKITAVRLSSARKPPMRIKETHASFSTLLVATLTAPAGAFSASVVKATANATLINHL
jgi:hypothetical protein